MSSLAKIARPPKEGSWLENIFKRSDAEKFIKSLSDSEAHFLLNDWLFSARAAQYREDGPWSLWVINAGRGFGKTRTGAEWVKENALVHKVKRQALVAPTNADLRKVMIEGESGILAVCPEAKYSSQRQTVYFPNDCIAEGFSAEEPSRLRGPQFEKAWCDEVSSWRYDEETWDMLQFALRLGDSPQVLVTSTPKAKKLYKKLLKLADRVSGGSTYENEKNLARNFIEKIRERYEGTRLGAQELHAQLLEDAEGALWKRDWFKYDSDPELMRVVVSVDPAASDNPDSDETGIVVAGIRPDKTGHVIADHTCKDTPSGWAKRAVWAYEHYKADCVVAEVNNGGDMVEFTLRTESPNLDIKKVHASRGKAIRAEPVSALYEQGKVTHSSLKKLDLLEDQLCNWEPESGIKSPDRLDAMVWAFTELMLHNHQEFYIA